MSASAAEVAMLRRMTAETTTATYSDITLGGYIERYPLYDSLGYMPTLSDGTENTNWTPTYDLNAAAAQIWGEKAAALAGSSYDFSADGGSYKRSQLYEQAAKRERYYASRRAPGSLRIHVDAYFEQDYQGVATGSLAGTESYIVNRAEDDD
jgi:hypothetical protein